MCIDSASTGTSGALDRRLHPDVARAGAFTVDVLDTLDVQSGMTPADIEADLATLEELWREKIDPALLY